MRRARDAGRVETMSLPRRGRARPRRARRSRTERRYRGKNPGNGGYRARAPVCARRGGACARGVRVRSAFPWTLPGARGGASAGASSGASRDRRRWTRPPRVRMSRQPLHRRPRASRCSPRGAISTVATPRWASRCRMGRDGRDERARREGFSASTRRRAGGTVEVRARPASLVRYVSGNVSKKIDVTRLRGQGARGSDARPCAVEGWPNG